MSVSVLRFAVSLYLTRQRFNLPRSTQGPFCIRYKFSFLTTIKPELSRPALIGSQSPIERSLPQVPRIISLNYSKTEL